VSGHLHAPAPLPEDGWALEPIGTIRRKFLAYQDSNSAPSFVQPVVSRYTDCARAQINKELNYIMKIVIVISTSMTASVV
jgi:hypothetical protein